MKRVGLFVPLLLLVAGCLQKEDPLLPELKGRWATEYAVKIRSAGSAGGPAPQPSTQELCRTEYVTFEKRAVTLHSGGRVSPFFVAREVKRDGPRIILTGSVPSMGASDSRVELLLRNGEIRFDDVSDERGRSIRYQRFENESARQNGVRTVGDVFRLAFDLKSCST
jgi:hypothetical protein